MAKNKPVGGYPSIKIGVEELSNLGYSNKEIADKLSVSLTQVKSASRFRTHFIVPNDVVEELKPHADARDVPVSVLIRYLLETIVYDGVSVDAILDDNKECPRSKKNRNKFIAKFFKNGMSAKELARKYNITPRRVYVIAQDEKNGQGKAT